MTTTAHAPYVSVHRSQKYAPVDRSLCIARETSPTYGRRRSARRLPPGVGATIAGGDPHGHRRLPRRPTAAPPGGVASMTCDESVLAEHMSHPTKAHAPPRRTHTRVARCPWHSASSTWERAARKAERGAVGGGGRRGTSLAAPLPRASPACCRCARAQSRASLRRRPGGGGGMATRDVAAEAEVERCPAVA